MKRKFDQAIKMKNKAWFGNVKAETSAEVARRLHQHDPTDSRISSLVSDAIRRVNDANWKGDFGTSHVREYINIIRPLQDMDWDHATLEDLRQRAVDVIDNIPKTDDQLYGVKLLMSSFEDQPVLPTIGLRYRIKHIECWHRMSQSRKRISMINFMGLNC